MILFWLSLLLLTVLACGFVLHPFWRTQPLDQNKQSLTNKAWYEDQLHALQKTREQKKISRALFEQELIALQQDFLMFQQSATVQEKNGSHRFIAILLACALSMTAFYLYQHFGASQILTKQMAEQKAKQKIDAKIQMMGGSQSVIYKLKARLALYPNDAQGWYLLGRIYFSENKFNAARMAFEHAVQLAPNRAEIVSELVEASYLSGDNRTESRLHQALQKTPNDPTLLNVSALILYQQKKYQQALNIWQHLLTGVPAQSDTEKALKKVIAQTEKQLSEEQQKH